jgi:hypothetical protein
MWSPSGQKIGFELNNWPAGLGTEPQYMCILEPMSGIITKHPQSPSVETRSYFVGWWDDGHFLEGVVGAIHIRDADSGAIENSIFAGVGEWSHTRALLHDSARSSRPLGGGRYQRGRFRSQRFHPRQDHLGATTERQDASGRVELSGGC